MKFLTILSAVLASSGVAMSATVGELGRRQTACTPGSTIQNPVVLTVNAGQSVSISAESHASNLQRLSVIPGHGGSTTTVFQGNGEDVPMPIISGGSGSGNEFNIPAQAAAFQLTLVFAFSTNNGNSFNVPIVKLVSRSQTTT